MERERDSDCKFCSCWEREPALRIAEFEQCFLMLNRDQFFPGYSLLFSKKHVTELFQLQAEERQQMMEELNLVAAALSRLFRADKINYELLGNMVPHIHWHLIPRQRNDRLWPRPVWAEPHQELFLTDAEYAERCSSIRTALENR